MRCKWQAHSAGRRRDTWDDRKAARRCRRLRPSLPTDRCRAVSISFCSLENLSGRGAWRAREKPLAWRALFAGGGTSTALTVKKKNTQLKSGSVHYAPSLLREKPMALKMELPVAHYYVMQIPKDLRGRCWMLFLIFVVNKKNFT